MSAESDAEDASTGTVTVRITDPELMADLNAAAEEVGSRSEAVRVAVRETHGDVGADGESVVEGPLADVPLKARSGYSELVDYTGENGHIELEAAESILANRLNISTDSVRKVVTQPLINAGVFGISQGVHEVTLVVKPLEDASGEGDLPDADDDSDGGEYEADDPSEAGDRLDELTAAGEEVADGE